MICILCTGLKPSIATAQSQLPAIQPPADWQFRYDLFKMSLEKTGLTVTRDIDTIKAAPAQSVVVYLGGVPSRSVAQFFSSFIQRGGAVLIATDQGLATALGRVRGRIAQTGQADLAYQGQPDCVRVAVGGQDSPLTRNTNELIFNRASCIDQLDQRRFSWNLDLRWPDYVQRDFVGRAVVASTESRAGGRGILCADHSIFTNGMLWHADNALFVLNVANWLAGSNRDMLFFSVDASPQASYQEELKEILASAPLPDVSLDEAPELEIEQMLRVANTVMANAEDANLANAYLEDRPRRLSDRHYFRSILFAIAAAIGCMAVYQLTQRTARPSRQPGPPRSQAIAAAAQAQKAPTVRRGEAAVLLCRDTLRGLTGSDDPESWRRLPASSPTMQDQISRVVKTATEPPMQLAASDLLEIDTICRDLAHDYTPDNN
ncbi:MAG: hypothetical protein Aurels2KO_20140 [Aureliella sp.]